MEHPVGTSASTTPVLRLNNLATGYGDLRVVWDVSLDVRPGEVTALLGRNGAGKTTTLRAIAGLNKVQGGSIEFAGRDISGLAAHRRIQAGIGVVQENKRVFKRRTVEANLLLGGYSQRVGRSALRAQLRDVYALFPILQQRAAHAAGQLSGGQQQMLAIGQALMAKPQLLLLDEPSAGLAPAIIGEVMASVRTLKQAGLAVLLVEQAMEAALGLADHVTVLDIGRVVLSRRASDLQDVDIIKDAYFGRAPDADS